MRAVERPFRLGGKERFMTTIGHFRRDGEGFVGRLTTVGLDATLRLVPAEKFSSKAPDYLVLVGEAECGAAWRATDASGALLNLKLDDPAWPEPVNTRLMAGQGEDLPLVWIRRSERSDVDRTGPP
jgi:uncharacterized protein (DUF736 family)